MAQYDFFVTVQKYICWVSFESLENSYAIKKIALVHHL